MPNDGQNRSLRSLFWPSCAGFHPELSAAARSARDIGHLRVCAAHSSSLNPFVKKMQAFSMTQGLRKPGARYTSCYFKERKICWKGNLGVKLMKKVILCFFFSFVLLMACQNSGTSKLQDGDIIFHTSTSSQSKAIQAATHSKYSHMGIIYHMDNGIYVFEAVQPVKLTPLKDWIKRGKGQHYVVKRLKNAEKILTPA